MPAAAMPKNFAILKTPPELRRLLGVSIGAELIDDAKKAHARVEDIKPFWK